MRRFPGSRRLAIFIVPLALSLFGGTGYAAESQLTWHTDVEKAYAAAEKSQRKLFVLLGDAATRGVCRRVEGDLQEFAGQEKLGRHYEFLRLSVDATVRVDGKPVPVIGQEGFAHLERSPGIAVVDLSAPQGKHFRQVISIVPLSAEHPLPREHLAILLALPQGSLTQRTMLYAVRIHPESPQSTSGEFCSILADEVEAHSQLQADLRRQGHHNWNARFYRINAKLPGNLVAQEVCAESWPGQGLYDAAVECVRSWRQSRGHWNAVRSAQPRFAYDLKRGSNGVWYATGLFGRSD